MSLNGAEIAAVCDRLHPRVADGRVQKVRAVDGEDAVVLAVRVPGETIHILVAVTPGAARLHAVRDVPPQPSSPPAFVMALRKRIIGAVVVAVVRAEGDRVVRLELAVRAGAFEPSSDVEDTPDDESVDKPTDGVPGERATLLGELTGRHGNLFLLDAAGTVRGALLPNKSALRALAVGASYEAPVTEAPADGTLREGWDADDPDRFLERTYAERVVADALDVRLARLQAAVRRARKSARRTVRAVERDLEAIDGADTLRRRGELLRGAFDRYERGAREVAVTDWFDPETPTVVVPLDPAMDLDANIQHLFRRYKRLRRGEERALKRLEEVEARLGAVEQLYADLAAWAEEADDAAALTRLESRAASLGLRKQQRPRASEKDAPRAPYHAFESSDGLPILVGRGSKDNDALTFHVARGNDLWMHAADWPGSHVIVRAPRGGEVPHTTLVEAALLAAHYSKGRGDTVVGVTYTQRKHIRKPKGAPPGRVTVAGGKTIDVRPDPERLRQLFDRRTPER